MSPRFRTLAVALIFAIGATGGAQVILDPTASPEAQGRAIMEAADVASSSPEAMQSESQMVVVKGDPSSPIVRRSSTYRLKRSESETWTLSETTFPSRMKILTYSHSDRDDEVWLKLSSGAPKRIAGSEKQGYVQNSHLTYEDMESMDLSEYSFRYLGEATISIGGREYACHRVQRVKERGEPSRYSRSNLYVTQDGLDLVRIDMWDNNGNPHKTWRVLELTDVEGRESYTIATRIGVSLLDDPTTTDVNEGDNQYTILEISDVRVDDAASISASRFRRESL